jgi:death-on-curing protein
VSSPDPIVWIADSVVHAIHQAQVAEHGGANGVRDPGLLDSALARPKNAHAYSDADIPSLAALYALGIIRNHPFVDGNKRVGTVLLETFLQLNGSVLNATDVELLSTIFAVAGSEMTDDAFIAWVQKSAPDVA